VIPGRSSTIAYIGLVDHLSPSLLTTSEATQPVTDEELMDAAATAEERTKWNKLGTELQYILIMTKGTAATGQADKQASLPSRFGKNQSTAPHGLPNNK